MRYMLLVYSTESPDGLSPLDAERLRAGHQKVMDEAKQKGVFSGAEPLASIATATTVRMQSGKALVTDGPFAETKEHLAGYYLLECANLDEAIEWASKIPTSCQGHAGCIEIRPMRFQAPRPAPPAAAENAAGMNG